MTLENWVYRTLIKFHNVALPYECNDMPRGALVRHLQKKVGFKVKLREASFGKTQKGGDVIYKTYLIAEEKTE